MNPDYEKRISDLEQKVALLTASSSFPRDVQNAIVQRFKFLTSGKTGSVGSATVYNAFPVTVPKGADGTLQITDANGKTYKVLYVN